MTLRKAGNSVGDISTPIALHCCIRWLSAGSFHDIRRSAVSTEVRRLPSYLRTTKRKRFNRL